MSIAGQLTEFSLAEIFQLLEQGQKTGLLTIRAAHSVSDPLQNFYLWFNQGQIVAAASRLDYKGLAMLIHQREWLGTQSRIVLGEALRCDRPLGLHLKCQGLLDAEQLKLLFYTQVMRQICTIFRYLNGWFSFEMKSDLPLSEMTGLSAVPTEVTLEGLRALKDWSSLVSKLPDPSSAITSLKTKRHYRINQLESRVWEFANGTESLRTISHQLQIPLEKIQQIAFRLMVVGLVEEVPQVVPAQLYEVVVPDLVPAIEKPLSQSFLHNLVDFLNRRVAR